MESLQARSYGSTFDQLRVGKAGLPPLLIYSISERTVLDSLDT